MKIELKKKGKFVSRHDTCDRHDIWKNQLYVISFVRILDELHGEYYTTSHNLVRAARELLSWNDPISQYITVHTHNAAATRSLSYQVYSHSKEKEN
jgi:hypothetical protein